MNKLQNRLTGRRRAYAAVMRTLMTLATVVTGALVLFLIVYVLFKGIPNFRETRIAMLRAETKEELFRIFEVLPLQAMVP